MHLHIRREIVSETVYTIGDFCHVRREYNDGSKAFTWRGVDGSNGLGGVAVTSLPLYGCEALTDAAAGSLVLVVEGEKSQEALQRRGVLAVGTVTGAKVCPTSDVLSVLQGFDVVLWPDNDKDGTNHMAMIAASLHTIGIPARTLSWPESPPKGDAFDFLETGGTRAELMALVETAVVYEKPAIPAPKAGPRLDVLWAKDVVPEPVTWLWRGRLARGKPTLLMGDPGLGKSLITHWLAAKISTGGDWPDGGRCEAATAIIFSTEDDPNDTVVPRLIAAGADLSRVALVRGVIDPDSDITTRMFALDQHLQMLEEMILETGAVFVVMDPISSYLGGDVNSHKEADVRAVLSPLSLMAQRTGIALLMLIHLNKGTGVSALYRSVGSIAFPAVCRVVLGAARDPNDDEGKRCLLLPIKMNIGELPGGIGYRVQTAEPEKHSILHNFAAEDLPPILAWDNEPVMMDAAAAMDRNGSVQELGSVAEAKTALTEILSGGKVPANEAKRQLRESVGTTSETVLSRARKELGVKVRKEGFGAASIWYWYAPEAAAERMSTIEASIDSREIAFESMESSIALAAPIPIKDSQRLSTIEGPSRARAETDRSEWEANAPCEGCHSAPPAPGKFLCAECSSDLETSVEAIVQGRPYE